MKKDKKVFEVSKRNFLIYCIGLVVSIALIGLGFIPCKCFKIWATVFLSIGASGIGAVILSFLIERSNNILNKQKVFYIRETKLLEIEYYALMVLERASYWYFRKRLEILYCKNGNKCHKITYHEMWDELKKIESQLTSLRNTDYDECIDENLVRCANKSLASRCEIFSNYINIIVKELNIFEALGYFTSKEISSLNAAAFSCGDIGLDVNSLEVDSLKNIFESLINISEFKHLKTFEFYYKNKDTFYRTTKTKDSGRIEKFSKEDTDSAIKHEERIAEKIEGIKFRDK